MKKNKLVQGMLAALLLLSVLFVSTKTVFAAGQEDALDAAKVNITLNKRIWDEGKTPTAIQNTGETTDFGGTPLNGSEFTVYDVTAKYYELINNSDQKTVIQQIQKDAEPVAPAYAIKDTSLTTTGTGQAKFTSLDVKNTDGKYKVYLFVETKTPNDITVTKRAVPLVVAMPIYKLDKNQKSTDVVNTDIQLYPKNETAKDVKALTNINNFTKVTVGNQEFRNVTTGDTLNYALTVNMPANIGDANAVTSFKINDKPSAGLALVAGTVKVGSLTADTDYKINYANGGFTIDFTLTSAAVKALAGQKLQVTYDMKLTADVNPDQLQTNNASVVINGGPEQEITPPTPVGTGGYKFVKKDAQTGKVLKGAEFIVTNKAGDQFATFTKNLNGDYVFVAWTDDKKEAATKVVSGDNGSINVIGLTNGTYVLNETKAPSADYVLLKDGTITFDVLHGTYGTSTLEVKNTPKGLLPSTGGSGIYAFLIIGAAMMLGAYVWFKKSRTTAEV